MRECDYIFALTTCPPALVAADAVSAATRLISAATCFLRMTSASVSLVFVCSAPDVLVLVFLAVRACARARSVSRWLPRVIEERRREERGAEAAGG
jgi:hypothetical protein